MYKRPVLGNLVLAGMMGLAIGFYALSGFAQEEEKEETITITTYYPSPYGSYKELEMHEGAIFHPHNSPGDYVEDLDCNADKEGKLVYGKKDSSVTEDTWYYCDGSEWKEKEIGADKFIVAYNTRTKREDILGLFDYRQGNKYYAKNGTYFVESECGVTNQGHLILIGFPYRMTMDHSLGVMVGGRRIDCSQNLASSFCSECLMHGSRAVAYSCISDTYFYSSCKEISGCYCAIESKATSVLDMVECAYIYENLQVKTAAELLSGD